MAYMVNMDVSMDTDTEVANTDTDTSVVKSKVMDTGAKWSTKLHLSTTHSSDPNRFITKSTNSTLCQCQLMSETLRSSMRPLK